MQCKPKCMLSMLFQFIPELFASIIPYNHMTNNLESVNGNRSHVSVELNNITNNNEDANETEMNTATIDPYAIQWEGENDKGCARNWSEKKKWLNTLFDALASLMTLMSGAALAPAVLDIAKDLKITQEKAQLILSIFVLSLVLEL